MKKLYMKWLLLCTMMMCSVGAWGEDEVYKTALFGSTYNSQSVSSYTATWTATNNGFTVSLANFNNNSNGWEYVKCGRKNNASVATITTSAVIDKAVTKVEITIDAITADKVNSIKLYTSSDGSSWTEAGSYTAAKGAQSVSPASPAANLYYKVEFDCASGTANGLVTISKVDYYVANAAAQDPEKTNVTLSFPEDSYDVSLFGSFTEPTLTTDPDDLTVTYSSSNTDVAEVDAESGEVTIMAEGSTVITATFAGDETYNSGSATYTLNVTDSREASELIFEDDSYEAEVGGSFDAPELLTDPEGIAVTYSSSNESVAIVNAETGAVTIVAKGTTTITATFAGNSEYKPGSASYTLTVTAGTVYKNFALVTNANTLKAGNNIMFVGAKNDKFYAMGEQKTNNRGAVEVSVSGNKISSFSGDIQQVALEGEAGAWYFNVEDGYLYAASSTANQLKTQVSTDDNAKATITIEDGTASVVFKDSGNRNVMQFNSSNTLFACYSSASQSSFQIFREVKNVTIGEAGFATLYSDQALDFSAVDGLTAYTATCTSSTVTLKEVADVPANTGVVLKGTAGTYSIPVIASSETGKGHLLGSASDATAYGAYPGYDLYILAKSGEEVQFTKVSSGSIAAGKAFLKVSEGASDEAKLRVVFAGETTGIEAIEATAVENDIIYNLSGQRVVNPTKGIFIKNGKKFIIK